MYNDIADYRKIAFCFIFAVVLVFFFFDFKTNSFEVASANSTIENVEDELVDGVKDLIDDIDSSELDDFIDYDYGLNFLDKSSFKDLAIAVLNGEYFSEYSSLFEYLKSLLTEEFKSLLSFFVIILVIVILGEVFKTFCVDKYSSFKKFVSVIFLLVIVLFVSGAMKNVADSLSEVIQKVFKFSNILFPILLNLILISGSTGTYSVYSSMSVFLLNTGSYVFVCVLLPLSVSLLLLSLAGSIFGCKRFSKTIDIFKIIFKYVVMIMFGVFGLFSTINLMTAGAKDGVGLKLTKYAIKNYVPVLGGYISDGFDFVHACSILVKNAFGFCGIVVLLFVVLKPLIVYFVYLILFKILALFVSYISSDVCLDMFDNVSKCMGYFIAVLVGLFLIMFMFLYLMIVSVSVI